MVSRPSRLRLAVAALSGAAALTLVASTAFAADDPWESNKGDCDTTAFKAPDETPLKNITTCGKLLLAYKRFDKISGSYKDRVVEAMNLLYSQGEEKDAKTAEKVLKKLSVPLPSRKTGGGAGGTVAEPKAKVEKKPTRPKYAADPPTSKQQKAADRQFKTGFKYYKKKDYGKALTYYLKMVDAAPGYEKAHYNVACIYALQGDEPNAVKYLQNLQDLGTKTALDNLKLARKDTDFDGIKNDSVGFKQATGYTRIKILNALGEMGEDNVDNLVASFKKLGHEVEDVSPSTKERDNPIVWYAPHAKAQAYIAKQLLNHPKTQTLEFEASRLKGFDLVITWGDKVKNDEPKQWVPDPDDAEKKIDDLARKQDEILSQPDEAIDEVDAALDKPGEVADKAEEIINKPGEAVDKVEGTFNKVKGLVP